MAYDTSVLVTKLKARGLDIAEEAANEVVAAVLDWVQESALASENKYDDLLLAALPIIRPQLLQLVDKIDGEVDIQA